MLKRRVSSLILLSLITLSCCVHWTKVDDILKKSLSNTTPGLSALVANKQGILYYKNFGHLTYGITPPKSPENYPIRDNTLFDIASLTKVVATTTSVMLLYEKGLIDLDMRIGDPNLLGHEFNQNGKYNITVKHLLLHNSGLPPGPYPSYSSKEFGCPETSKLNPQLSFSCANKIYDAILKQKSVREVEVETVYSDLSMIILSFVVGKIVEEKEIVERIYFRDECQSTFKPNEPGIYLCYFDAYVKKNILSYYGMNDSDFLPIERLWENIAPTWNETGYRRRIIQGEVSDSNAFAMGGISGHAGLFSNSVDLLKFSYYMLFPEYNRLNKTTIELFTNVYDKHKSSRALGWDTNHYTLNTHRGCGNLSESTFTHTGYTGTQICIDKERQIITILLTNRVYPDPSKTTDLIKYLRRDFSNAVKDIIDKYYN